MKRNSTGNKIVVTGGAGFIGANLCARLVSDGNRVICVDNFSTGRKENLRDLIKNDLFNAVNHDISSETRLELHADQIYNLACPASPAAYKLDPTATIKTCVVGSSYMLDLCREHNAKILQASTSEIYGNPETHPQTECDFGKTNTLGVRSCYTEGKRCAEAMFFSHHLQYGTDIAVARLFNVYGPLMSSTDGRVVPNFITQALRNEPITIHGDGSQTRSFCYVSDMVDALVALMNSESVFCGPINLGNPHEISVLDLATTIISMTKSKSKILRLRDTPDDPRRRCPDISKAKSVLNWEPTTSLSDGLTMTIDHIDNVIRKSK